jgi:hypothetical protein
MHSLRGVFIQSLEPIGSGTEAVYQIKIHFPGFKSRHLYFTSEVQQKTWAVLLKQKANQRDFEDHYMLGSALGKG